jgi:hypothetical protein
LRKSATFCTNQLIKSPSANAAISHSTRIPQVSRYLPDR